MPVRNHIIKKRRAVVGIIQHVKLHAAVTD